MEEIIRGRGARREQQNNRAGKRQAETEKLTQM